MSNLLDAIMKREQLATATVSQSSLFRDAYSESGTSLSVSRIRSVSCRKPPGAERLVSHFAERYPNLPSSLHVQSGSLLHRFAVAEHQLCTTMVQPMPDEVTLIHAKERDKILAAQMKLEIDLELRSGANDAELSRVLTTADAWLTQRAVPITTP
jgi:hypothetical protein